MCVCTPFPSSPLLRPPSSPSSSSFSFSAVRALLSARLSPPPRGRTAARSSSLFFSWFVWGRSRRSGVARKTRGTRRKVSERENAGERKREKEKREGEEKKSKKKIVYMRRVATRRLPPSSPRNNSLYRSRSFDMSFAAADGGRALTLAVRAPMRPRDSITPVEWKIIGYRGAYSLAR